MNFLRTAAAVMILCSGLSLIQSRRHAQAAEADKVNVCYSSIAATSITTWVPHEAGI